MPSDARILVVDDEPKICMMLRTALEREGYAVETCLDGATALERVRAAGYDVVISDIRMPGLSGFELIHRIKEARPRTVVVAITGHATVETEVNALRCGADDYITKPFDIAKLRRVVETSVRSQQLLGGTPDSAAGVALRTPTADAVPAAVAALAAPGAGAAQPLPLPAAAQDLLESNRRLEQRVAELITIQEITQAVMAELRLDRLLDTCLVSVGAATGARCVSILLYDAAEECLVVRARRGRDRRRIVGERCALGEGIAGWIAQHRVPLLIQCLDEQPVFRAMARNDGYDSGSFAAVPLAWQERLLGVLCATDKAEGRPFEERDLRLLLGVATQIAIAIENARQYESLQQNAFNALRTLADSFEVKGSFARGHSERVATYATRAARELGLSAEEIETLRQAAQLHDIGNVAISETILGRSGPLSDNEFSLVREHPLRSERILQSLGFLDAILPLVRHHHERWDGKGYPDSLKGREIDPMTRILTLADAFDAMTTPRPYRGTLDRAEAFAELAQCAGAQFDPRLIEPFRRAVGGLA